MAIDDSFRKPGVIPFEWEIKPGVPKVRQEKQVLLSSTQKLIPPPSCSPVLSPSEPRIRSFRSASRTRSERWRFESQTVSVGCFPSPLFNWRNSTTNKKVTKKMGSEPEADLEKQSRWSASSRKSLFSPLHNSPSSTSSFSSYKSSPRPLNDAEWAGFGLF